MITNTPLIHIGYHKTGTTWLQKRLFVRNDLGFDYPFPDRNSLTRDFVIPDTLQFDATALHINYYKTMIYEYCQKKKLVPVISNERFSGFPSSGGYDSKTIADRLKTLFPNVRILIMIREQAHVILSNYLQYVKDGGPCTLWQYLTPTKDLRARVPSFRLEFFCYDILIQYYMKLFGAENVLVLPYEMFLREPKKLATKILAHCGLKADDALLEGLPFGIRENQTQSLLFFKTKRLVNIVFGRRTNPAPIIGSVSLERAFSYPVKLLQQRVQPRPRSKSRPLNQIKEFIGGFYGTSNTRTAQLIHEDLEKWGYTTDTMSHDVPGNV